MGEAFLRAILDSDRVAALEEARGVLATKGLRSVYEELIAPAFDEIGSLWEHGRISIADEHIASAVAQSIIAELYPDVKWPPRGPKVVVAAVQGEQHTMGARMVSDLLALDGWNDLFLGPGVPPIELAKEVRDSGATLVALSASTRARLPALRESVQAIRALAPRVKIVLGGRITRQLPETAEQLGIDAIAGSAGWGSDEARRWLH